MSLVNDMLKDLDTRKQVPASERRTGVIVNVEVEGSSLYQTIKAIVIALLIVGGLGGGYYFYSSGFDSLELNEVAANVEVDSNFPLETNFQQPSVGKNEIVTIDTEVDSEEVEVTGINLELKDFEITSDQRSFRLYAEEPIAYSAVQKTSNSISFRIENVSDFEMAEYDFPGLTLSRNGSEVLVLMETARESNFEVFAESSVGNELVLNAAYVQQPSLVQSMEENIGAELERENEQTQPVQESVELTQAAPEVAVVMESPVSVPNGQVAETTVESEAVPAQQEAIRRNRGLNLDQRDRNVAQEALESFRAGRLLEAQDSLLTFIDENPEAHNSRETLANILINQKQEYQAETLIDEGLSISPNYVAFKKHKARLLMQRSEFVEAMELLRRLPPSIAFDTEYHAILASLYQRNSEFGLAETVYQDLLRVNQDVPQWWLGLAISMENLAKNSGAARAYQEALDRGLKEPGSRRYAQSRITYLRAQ